jgi:hypothetical protein
MAPSSLSRRLGGLSGREHDNQLFRIRYTDYSKLELAPAMRDHDSQVVIKGLEEQITTQQRSLNACLTANA